jgi:hypothetical protein
MSCQDFEAFVLDETLPKPAGHDAHVAGCESCRALKAGHRAALRLHGVAPRRTARLPTERVVRRASIAAALTLVLGGSAGLVALEAWRPAPPAEVALPEVAVDPRAAVEEPALLAPALPDEAPPVDDAWAGLAELHAAVATATTTDPRDDEVLSRAFGPLPEWVAPTKTYPLRALGAAVPHLVYTSED